MIGARNVCTDLPARSSNCLAHPCAAAAARLPMPLLVLDTNVVLDWLYFADPRCAGLAQAVAAGQVRWLATTPMRDELRHVLERGVRPARPGDSAAVWAGWQRWASLVEPEGRAVPAGLRCTDPDDQKFIDLALQAGACALLSRDRAVLKLARRAAVQGLRIESATAWSRRQVGGAVAQLDCLAPRLVAIPLRCS